ncbi:MAG: Polynucleotide 5'-hydroxyl-kinase grc3 [Claussenomyces sp. TS43310]|nr:MAG: Polynucleotide 5'-hydroxyl-kinase grc3 [Claussenomyces sp. TS43310]
MSSNKRRKLDKASAPNNISAFAARRLLKAGQYAGEGGQKIPSNDGKPAADSQQQELLKDVALRISDDATDSLAAGFRQSPDSDKHGNDYGEVVEASGYPSDASVHDQEADMKLTNSRKSREPEDAALSQQPAPQWTTLKPNEGNVKESEDGSLWIEVTHRERLVVLGQYRLSVIKGQITILGATLSASQKEYEVYALSSHSLPVIRSLSRSYGAQIRLHQCDTGLHSLKHLSPLFHRLSNEDYRHLRHSGLEVEGSKPIRSSTFHILYSTNTNGTRSYMWPLTSPPEWNEAMATIISSQKRPRKPAITTVCGPKSSGKSTFSKLLINRLITTTPGSHCGVAFLDLDPGQPEYSPPGHLSLIHLLQPDFGPPYSHPDSSCGMNKLIRAHSIGAVSPSANPDLYMACVTDLLNHYNDLASSNPGCSLVINTPGWVLGTGLELLISLIKLACPTEIVYMSTEGPWDVVNSLKDTAGSIPVLTVPSQLSEFATRTAAHLRIMQMMSYFHLRGDRHESSLWSSTPVTSMPPWEVKYTGKGAGIFGIMSLGEQPAPCMLGAAINGSILSVVAIDSEAAIEGFMKDQLDGSSQQPSEEHNVEDDGYQHCRGSRPPIIIETPEKIPYFNPANSTTFVPQHSRVLGLALLRGIDIKQKMLQLLSPVSAEIVAECTEAGKSLILISGKLDTPGWAYTEELNRKVAEEKRRRKNQTTDVSEDSDGSQVEDDLDGNTATQVKNVFERVPWIEKLKGHEGRGVGARIWRVRRDLGRSGDGGGH